LLRPKQWLEAVWACLGAVLLVASGLVSGAAASGAAGGAAFGAAGGAASGAAGEGTDVYLFLTGMMLLASAAALSMFGR
jgi:arsenical pump membrane protein